MKILGSDFDGTFTHGGINEEKLSALEKWRESGNKFGIVSGRGPNFYTYLSKKIPKLQFDFLAVCSGGYIMDGNGSVIYEVRCTDVPLSEFAADLFAWGCKKVWIDGERYLYIVKKAEDRPDYVSEADICLLENTQTVDYFYQVSIDTPSVEEASAIVDKINSKYAKWLNPLQNGGGINVVPACVDKAQGMYRVMEIFGGKYEDVITVGDNYNDMDMIREFRSYAMKNGVEALKDQADGIVSDVIEIFENEL